MDKPNDKITVLIVDDEVEILDMFKREFEAYNCNTLVAKNGIEALEIVSKNQIDIVITDVCMPEMDGMKLLQIIEQSQGRRPFVVTMSGYSTYTPEELYEKGAAGYLAKPLSFQQLRELIENYVLLVGKIDDFAA